MKFKSIAFHHFGCKVNFSEASSLSRSLQEKGLEIRNFHEQADVYVISTCVVTAVAEKKCRAAIRQAHKLNPEAKIAVIGCFSELKPDEIKQMDGVDLVLGHNGKFRLAEELENLGRIQTEENSVASQKDTETNDHAYHFIPSYSSGDRTRSFLKIQDGCDYFCSYCAIPFARGRSRSDSVEHVLSSVKEIAARNIHEIVLTGVNIGDFGKKTGESFFELLQQLNNIQEIKRFRISSIEPDLLSDQIIELVAHSANILPHFHIPLQSGNNRILEAMRRKYTRELYSSRVRKIKSLMPHACIAADIIVGYPGETAEDFTDTCSFLEDLDISYLHVFTYSKRENTRAALAENTISDKEKKYRSDVLHAISDRKKEKFYKENTGRMVNVLFESDFSAGFMHGFSENYIKVKTKQDHNLSNSIVGLRLDKIDNDGIYIYEP
jgi:threonylcarbamoyladenosine tRNA methylthiotransferase MtaB